MTSQAAADTCKHRGSAKTLSAVYFLYLFEIILIFISKLTYKYKIEQLIISQHAIILYVRSNVAEVCQNYKLAPVNDKWWLAL